jgi:signal transduction histidine kinase/CheY-like chemotaxis protein
VKQPSIRGWAWIIASLALASLSALGIVSGLALAPHATMVRQAEAPILPLYSAATARERDLRDELAAAFRYVGSGDTAALADLAALRARAEQARDPQLRTFVSPRFRTRLDRADSLLGAAQAAIDAAVAARRQGRRAAGLSRLAAASAVRQRLADEMAALVTASVEDAQAVQERVVAAAERARTVIGASVLLALILLVASVALMRRRVIRPMARLHDDVRVIAGGDLAHRAVVHADDEIGELARDVNQMTTALEARLRQQDRLTAVGELAAGLAHELNNPLQVVLAQASHWDPAAAPEETREAMHLIATHARRAGRVVQGLLAFVRARPTGRRPAQLNTIVQATVDLLAREFRAEQVALDVRLALRLPEVRADAGQIEQVLTNLLANALHAACRGEGDRRVLLETRAESDTVVAAVEDSGPGIPLDARARVFDPFFTTKTGEGGVGLGLSIAVQIAHGHGGTLSLVDGTLGGARLELRLPALEAPTAPGATAEAARGAPRDGVPAAAAAGARAARRLEGLRLLVADDEDAVRRSWTRYFTRLGARVDAACDGAEALDRIRSEDYDAVVLDLKMPRLSGWEVLQAARIERPAVASRVVVVSGDITALLELGTAEHLQPWRMIEKPADLDTIRDAVLRAAQP